MYIIYNFRAVIQDRIDDRHTDRRKASSIVTLAKTWFV